MDVPFLKFLPHRLNSLLLQETEIFCGLEDPIQRLVNTLHDIALFSEETCSTKDGSHEVFSLADKLRDLINEIDDRIDEFILQMDLVQGSDRLTWIENFRSELENFESRSAKIVFMKTSAGTSNSPGQEKIVEETINQVEDQRSTLSVSTFIDDKIEIGSTITRQEKEDNIITSCLINNLPYFLRYSLLYCCVFPENYWIHKGKLVRLLVAEGLVQEKPGKIKEDIVEENINELISKNMLLVKDEHPGNGTKLTVAPLYRDITLQKTDDGVLVSPLIDSGSCSYLSGIGHRAFTSNLKTVIPQLHNLRTRSLLLFKIQDLSADSGDWLSFYGAKFLRVLDLEGAKIKKLPDQVGELSHLAYLGLKQTDISELPAKLGNLRLLQTLDIRWCGNLTEVPIEVLNLVRLRHLKMFKSINVSGVKLPKEIRRLTNLLTLTGVHAGAGIAEELSNLIRLRRLGVMDLSEENITELFASIMKMQDLRCLSLEVNKTSEGSIVLPELFSPPSRIRKLCLEGHLGKIPTWVGSMESVTILRLGFSNLVENPMLVLQVLPNLKKLTLWQAYDAKKLGKEFCRAGGFLKLEDLSIASRGLEEWSELEEGALPSLEYLHFHNCSQLKMLPEGLQFITTLKKLDLLPLLDDHMERLKPDGGEENCKIRHIPSVTFLPVSVLRNKFSEFMQSSQTYV